MFDIQNAKTTEEERRDSARGRLFTLVEARNCREPLWAWDISLSGMQCRTQKTQMAWNLLDLRFALPTIPDVLEVGSQVMTLDQMSDASVGLGLRFCNMSVKVQRLIYRFLDQRRHLWDRPQPLSTPLQLKIQAWLANFDRPFEAWLLQAFASIKAKELSKVGFVRY